MTKILDTLKGLISTSFDDESKNPLHVGEVMNLWTYTAMLQESNRYAEVALNTTTDDELITALNMSIENCQVQITEIEELLKKEGIDLPPVSSSKPQSNPNDVPAGAKLTDDEIANGISAKTAAAMVFCGTGLSQSIRNDIATMWLGFFMVRAEFGAYFRPVMRKRGWIKVPPYYYTSVTSKQ